MILLDMGGDKNLQFTIPGNTSPILLNKLLISQRKLGFENRIKHLKNTGVRVDAIGFQCHLNVGIKYDYKKLERNRF